MSRRNRKNKISSVPSSAQAGRGLPPAAPGTRQSWMSGFGFTAPVTAPLTIEEVRRMYGPAHTLGAPENVRMACDSQLNDGGFYGLLQHTLAAGQMPLTQFQGYGFLQQIAQNGLIRACIETTADDLTRNWIEFKRDGEKKQAKGLDLLFSASSEEPDIIEKLKAECDYMNIRQVMHDAAAITGYSGGCLIFIDTGASGSELLEPLHIGPASAELQQNRPLRFTPIDPINVFPGLYNSLNPLRQDYFKPRTWWVLGQEVHASRLIRVVANEVPLLLKPSYNFLGLAQAQILWDYVLHFQECRVATARMLTKFSLTVLKTDMQEVLTMAGGTEQLDRRVQYFVQSRSNDGVQVIDRETEDIVKIETPIGGMSDVTRQALEFLAAINRTPAVKLLGISPSGFNATGESDLRNYYDHIRSQQEKLLRPALETILKILQIRLAGQVDPSLTFDFAPLSEADQAAIAVTQKTKADTAAVWLDRGVVSAEECRQALAADPDSGFENLDVDALPDPADEPEQEEEAPIDDVDKAGEVYG